MSGERLRYPDANRLPYGDIAHDDDACIRYIKMKQQMYQLGIAKRKNYKRRRKPRKSFDEWLKKARELDDDTPLRSVISTL